MIIKFIASGILATLILMVLYGLIVYFVSGVELLKDQLDRFWFYLLILAAGFGVQVGLYRFLKFKMRQLSTKVVVTTGGTTTASMVACCTHYLTNILPVLGAAGIITFITQFQVQLFWLGIVFNLLGIIYLSSKIVKVL